MASPRIFFTSSHWYKGLVQVQQDEPYCMKRDHHYQHKQVQSVDKCILNQPNALP